MLLDMALPEMVSGNLSRRRLGYRTEIGNEDARSRFQKLYSTDLFLAHVVHGWGYRRYVVESIEKTRNVSLAQSEFDYTTSKTNNISNFSAWHNRANLIPKLLPPISDSSFEEQRRSFLASGEISKLVR